jgi:hypothetical protein
MISNMATTWKKGLLLLGLAMAVFTAPVMGVEDSWSSSAGASVGKSYLKGSKNKKQQGQRRLAATKKGGLAYQIDFAAADPDLYTQIVPYPENFIGTNKLIVGRGNADDTSIPFAKFNDAASPGPPSANVKVESLMPETLYLGQIVPFEIKISVSGLDTRAEDGKIQFTAGWSTKTTSKGDFGYEFIKYGVLAAFVDTADGAHVDTGSDATVDDFSWTYVTDAKGNEIQGVFNLSGLDDGDEIVVEVWVVIQSTFPSAGATGNVQSRLISAETLTTKDTINTGTQTVPMMKMQAGVGAGGFTDDAQLRIIVGTAAEDEIFC